MQAIFCNAALRRDLSIRLRVAREPAAGRQPFAKAWPHTIRPMRRCLGLPCSPCSVSGAGRRSPAASPALPARACSAARRSPRPSGAAGIPEHLLAAIRRVESGRRDPQSGAWHPWPWTINAEGQGFFYDTKAEAVAAVRPCRPAACASIDVGCGQINLMHHPNAFPSLEAGVRPAGERRLCRALPQ